MKIILSDKDVIYIEPNKVIFKKPICLEQGDELEIPVKLFIKKKDKEEE